MTDTARGVAHYSHINPGSRLRGVTSQQARIVVAGSGDDNAWKEGAVIDRTTPALFLGGQGVTQINPTLNTGETVTVSRRYRHASDAAGPFEELPSLRDSEIADVVITAAEMVATPGPRTYLDNLDLAGAKKFIRHDVKVNLSRANTDTCGIGGAVALAGDDVAPVN